MTEWNENQPIFLQIRQRLVEMILKGQVKPGEALPSIRQASADLAVNPLTVTKAYQSLVDQGVVEKKRGMGMYVSEGAHLALLEQEREAFLSEVWPRIRKQIEALNLDLETLMKSEADK